MLSDQTTYNHFLLEFRRLSYAEQEVRHRRYIGTNEINYVEHGACTISIENLTLTATAGQCVFIPANLQNTYYRLSGEPFLGYSFGFRFFPNVNIYQYAPQIVPIDESLIQLISDIPSETEITCNSIWRFYKFLHHFQPLLSPTNQKHLNVVNTALEYMQYHNIYDVTTLAEACHLKKSQFYDLFKQVTGTTPIMEKQRIQAQKAEVLLKTTTLSIREIADQLGFQSESHFRRVFKSRYRISPCKYRNLDSAQPPVESQNISMRKK